MSDIILTRPSRRYADDIRAFRREVIAAGDKDSFAGCSMLDKYESPMRWIANLETMQNSRALPDGRVPSDTYIAVRKADDRIVGIIDLRHHINHPILGLWGGHIGYTVRPCERRKGYGTQMLKLQLENCRALGLGKVLVTCSRDNTASEKVIKRRGGVFEKDVDVRGEIIKRYWIDIHAD